MGLLSAHLNGGNEDNRRQDSCQQGAGSGPGLIANRPALPGKKYQEAGVDHGQHGAGAQDGAVGDRGAPVHGKPARGDTPKCSRTLGE